MKDIKFKQNLVILSLIFTSNIGLAHEIENSSYNTTASIGFRAGDSVIEGYVDFIVPIWKNKTNHLFFNPRLLLADEGNNQFNVGIGYRYLFENRGILGGNVFFDSRESNLGFRYEQFGAGLEWLGKSFDARINVYDAQDELELVNSFETSETQTSQQISTSQTISSQTNSLGDATPVASGNTISQTFQTETSTSTTINQRITTRSVTTNRTFEQFEGALDGWDAELGFKLPIKTSPEIRFFGGYYSYDNPFSNDDIEGVKARVQVRSGNYLTFEVEYFEDSFDPSERGSDYFVGARLEVPLTGKDTWKNVVKNLFGTPNRSLEDRLHHEMIIRDVRIHTDISDPEENESLRSQTVVQSTRTETSTETETTSSSDTAILADNVYFVDPENTAVETGAVETPFQSIADAVNAAPANATVFVCESGGGVCDLNGGGGTFDETTGINLQAGQTLTSSVAGFTTQNKPIITNSTQAANTGVINTAGNNTINRLVIETVNLNARHGVFNNQTTAPITVNNSHITTNGNNSDAIFSTQTTSVINITNNTLTTNALNSNTIENNATIGNVLVSNNTLVSNAQNGDGVQNNGTIGSVTISNNTFNGTAQNARSVFNNGTTGPVIISNNAINTSGVLAEGIQNTDVQGPITITSNAITTVDGDGIFSNGTNTGDITITNNSITTNGNQREGILSNTVAGDITISGNTVTTTGNDSEAIQTNNSTGNITVTGNTVSTAGTGAEGIFNNNNAATPSTGTTTTVSNNAVSTQNTSADGIVNIGRTDVAVSGNIVTTAGDNAEGIRSNLVDDGLNTTNNIVTTTGTGSEGILNTNIIGATAIISNNTVNTTGNNSEGIETNPGAANTPAVTISGNTVITQGEDAHALNTTTIAGTADINSNDLNTNEADAFGSRNRTVVGGTIIVNGNTICVPVGGQNTNNAGAGTTTVGANALLNQTPCP